MIFSSYSNPPYRKPSLKATPTPPPARNPSPKRKRAESQNDKPKPALQVDTQRILDDAAAHDSGGDSPRTFVAERLKGLDLRRVNNSGLAESLDQSEMSRKRTKHQDSPRNEGAAKVSFRMGGDDKIKVARPLEDPQMSAEMYFRAKDVDVASTPTTTTAHEGEIGETPDCKPRPPSSPGQRKSIKRKQEDMLDDAKLDGLPPRSSPKNLQIPEGGVDHSVSPTKMPDVRDPYSERAQLTWHDDEITGQEIDYQADDDGEGINGLGFRPTPAMAYVRSQKRQRQIDDWKNREAREARQRRIEKRRGGDAEGGGGHGGKRTVRFTSDDD